MKNIIVTSHERSGTHFLINSIANCFGLSNVCVNLPFENITPFLKQNSTLNNRIYKSHHDARFFPKFSFCDYKIIYIYRDPLDVLTSCYYYYKMYKNSPHTDFPFPVDEDINKFLFETKPHLYKSDKGYSYEKYENNIERLYRHRSSWFKVSDKIHLIQYELLHQNFNHEINRISNYTERKVIEFKKPSVSGVAPRKGIIGDHKNLFSKVQIEKIINMGKKYE